MRDTNTTRWWLWMLPLPLVWWAALAFATHWTAGGGLAALLAALNAAMAQPWVLRVTVQTPRFLALFTLAYAVLAVIVAADLEVSTRNGEEHGSARWGDVREMAARYRAKIAADNIILTRHFRIGLDGRRHKRNLNILVLGGSGAGKSRTHAVPNILQGCCSFVVTDPNGNLQ